MVEDFGPQTPLSPLGYKLLLSREWLHHMHTKDACNLVYGSHMPISSIIAFSSQKWSNSYQMSVFTNGAPYKLKIQPFDRVAPPCTSQEHVVADNVIKFQNNRFDSLFLNDETLAVHYVKSRIN